MKGDGDSIRKILAMVFICMMIPMAMSVMTEEAGAVEATVSSITMDLCPTDETFSEGTYNAQSQSTVKAQIIYTGTGDREGHLVNFSLQQRNSDTGVYYYKTHRVLPTDENGTVYWNINLYNLTYPAVAYGSQEYSFNISTRGASLPMGDSPGLKYVNQTFTMGATDNATIHISAPDYVAIGSLFRPFIQVFTHDLRLDTAGANVSVDIRHWNYAGTNTTVQSMNIALNNNSWVQPTFFINDSAYDEGYYELFVGIHNNTGAGYPHFNYLGAPATGGFYYHRAWYGFRVVYNVQADAGVDQSAQIAANVTLDGTASQADVLTSSGAFNYTWSKVSGPSATIIEPYTDAPYYTPASIGLYRFRLNVTNDYGHFAYDYTTVRVYDTKVTLAAGWNLVAYPLTTATAASVITGKSTLVTTVVTRVSASTWTTYDQTAGITDFNVTEDEGIWIYSTAAVTITF